MDAPAPSLSISPLAESPVAASPAFTRKQVLRVLSGILLCMLLAAIDQNVVVPAVPAIAADLKSYSHLSWIISAYLLTSTAATPIYGKLSDLYGRRALLLPAIVWFVFASVLCGFAPSLPQLVVFRALQGIGGAGLLAMAQASIADVVAPRERGKYQAYISGVWAAASIAGPVLGGWVTDASSWRWIFWLNVPIGAAAFVLCDRALRMLKARRLKARIDYAGAALLTVAITCPLLILSWGGESLPVAFLADPVARPRDRADARGPFRPGAQRLRAAAAAAAVPQLRGVARRHRRASSRRPASSPRRSCCRCCSSSCTGRARRTPAR